MIRRRLVIGRIRVVLLGVWLVAACASPDQAPSPSPGEDRPVASQTTPAATDALPAETTRSSEPIAEPTPEPTAVPTQVPTPTAPPSPIALAPEPTEPEAADPWGLMTRGIGRDGTIPLDVALSAFAQAMGPLPGVETPVGGEPPISSGSGATRWLIGHWDELSSEQQAAAAAILLPPAPPVAAGEGLIASIGDPVFVAATAAAPACASEPTGPKVDELRAKLDEVVPQIADKLKRPLGIPVIFTLGDVPDRPGIAANTTPADANCGPAQERPAYCQIQVTNRGQGLSGFEFTHLVAHEAFHCFQYDFATSARASGRVPPWLAEGSAAWVGEVISFGSTIGGEYWENWLKEPQAGLFGRTYDGIGFFMHLAESGIDPWPSMIAMHRKGESSSADAYAAVVKGSGAARMIDAWGPSYVRDVALQPDWSTGGPGLPDSVRSPVTQESLTGDSGTGYILSVVPQAAWASKFDAQADVVVLQGQKSRGLVRFSDGSEWALRDVLGKPICLKPGGCTCPSDSAGAGHTWMTASKGQMLVGVSGHTDGAHVLVDAFDVDTTCDHPPDDFRPEEPCWCPPGPLGRSDGGGPGLAIRYW